MRRLALVLLVAAACGSSESPRAAVAVTGDQAEELLINRNWLDRWPTREDERLHVYRFTPAMGGGVYQDRTLYAGSFELFTYEVDGDHLTIALPHKKERRELDWRIDRVDGPEPFDLRLTLAPSPRGPRVYYGRSAEHSGDQLALPPLR